MKCTKDKKCWDCEHGFIEYKKDGRPSQFHCLLDSRQFERTCVGNYSRPKESEMDNKLLSNEIKEALENEIHLAEYVDSDYCSNTKVSLLKSTLDLINQYEAEQNKKVKEFAERLKEKYRITENSAFAINPYALHTFIDNLLKEMGVE